MGYFVVGFDAPHKFFLSLLLVLHQPSLKVSADRTVKIESHVCPPKYCLDRNYSIVHVTADSKERNNSIHYLYSTIHSPTIMLAYFENVPNPINLTIIDWKGLINGTKKPSLKFSQHFDHLMALVVPRIIAFEDPKDKLFYTEKDVSDITTHSFESVTWAAPNIKDLSVEFSGDILGGNIALQCNISVKDDREEQLPSLLYTDNSTRFTFTLKNLTGLDKVNSNTRLGLELFSITPQSNRDTTNIVARKSIDDEYTPAVFKTIVVNNTGINGNSYVAWKPVAYTSKVRSLSKQLPSFEYLVVTGRITDADKRSVRNYPPDFKSIAFAFKLDAMNAHGINISFGQSKDGWYQKDKYLSWTGLVGYGEPQFDSFSSTILITIIAGLGAPLIVLLFGGLYVGVKKYKENKMASAYGRIN